MPAETPLIPLSAIAWIGEGLARPECVLTTAKGEVFVGDHHAGIAEIGKPKRHVVGAPPGFLPNGVAMTRDREFLIANLGPPGGVWRLDRDWRLFPHLFEADGELLRVCNFVGVDQAGTEWISVSTRAYPRELSFHPTHADGFIVRRDADGAHIVADGIGFTNECRVDPTGRWLYVNETCAKRVSRFPVKGTTLGKRETVHEFGPGEFPDGFAFDCEGGVWVACVCSNRLIRIETSGRRTLILDDAEPADVAWAEDYFKSGKRGRAHVEIGGKRGLKNIASVAFGGPDLKTVYLGNLAGQSIPTFRSPVAGAEPVQWRF
ncbi:MAG: SMP-30/gluconolactonase/LRE family protein [Hyphomicrobiaceae bacterium]|nr:SMP-30/gluconolactonase/LRE family protein [Hyphomicrobiaceae bacterium]